jgi:Uma2 family endonuclease
MATTMRKTATEEDLLRTPKDGSTYELVDGEIRVSPGGARHGAVSLRLAVLLHAFVTERQLGFVFESNTGFRLPSGNIRSPDTCFVSAGRFADGLLPDGFANLAPDLAVEVISPGDRARHVFDKVGEYLEAGVRLVWVIDPRRRRAVVYRSLSEVRELREADELDGEDVLPGFHCTLSDILA